MGIPEIVLAYIDELKESKSTDLMLLRHWRDILAKKE